MRFSATNVTAPAGAATVAIETRKVNTPNWVVGSTYDVADYLVEQSATLDAFFAGDTPGDGTYVYSWTGVANESISQQTLYVEPVQTGYITSDYQFQFGDEGTVLNQDLPSVPFVDVTKVSGLDNGEYRVTERAREGMDGGYIDARFLKPRTIVIEGIIYGDESYLETLKADFAASEEVKPLYWQASSRQRIVFCKSLGLQYDWTTSRRTGSIPFQVQLKAEDPNIYSTALMMGSTPLGTPPTTGMTFPLAFPLTYGGTGAAAYGSLMILNNGNKPTSAVFHINGAVIDPEIVHDNSGKRLSFSGTFSPSDVITVDTRNRTVLLNGSYRRTILKGSSRWFNIDVGSNTVRFLGTAVSGNPTLDFFSRPAFS
jgi:hypothetical protein